MKSRILVLITIAVTIPLTAKQDQEQCKEHPQYKLVDMGTFGGRQSYLPFYAQSLNNKGAIAGWGDTLTPDPNFPNFDSCFNSDCLFSHAFEWHNDTLTELPTLAGGDASNVSWISNSGLIVGASQNGAVDPVTGQHETRAVLWTDDQIADLGTLGGNESLAIAVNSQGLVVGAAANAIADHFPFFFGWATQTRAFIWQNGVMRDLGTLGGPDAFAGPLNERGQVIGCSYANSTPNPTTGIPTIEPFLWENGKMFGLGTLGGAFGCPNALNNRGQVVGASNLAGDLDQHPFLWKDGKMIDLGTFGGTLGEAISINEAGWAVGTANYPSDKIHRAALWKDGKMADLGVIPGDKCSTAWSINSKAQIVGASGDCGVAVHAFLWEDGHMVDLTRLMPPGVELTYGLTINDRGEIAAIGRVSGCGDTGCQHAFLLMPIDKDGGDTNVTPAVTQNSPAPNRISPQLRRKVHN
jgi:probable HAF family extracellular repeat protein